MKSGSWAFFQKKTYPTKPSNNITGKTPPDKIKQPEVPIDVFAALHADTGKLKIAGWNLPPGATWVNYVRPDNACALVPRVPHLAKKNKPTVARYAVAGIVLPRITEAISIANRVHDALCKWSDQGAGPTSVFTGIGAEGKPLAGHRHAHIFCESNGLHDAITHITVWAEMGFDNRDCVALHCLNKIWGHGGHDIRLVLTSLDQPETFPDCKLFGTSKLWRSATPFVPTRHAKTFHDGRPKVDEANGCQIGSAAHDLLRLIAINLKTTGVSIRQNKTTTIGEPPNAHLMHFLHQFQTTRHGGKGCRSHDHGGLFTITFAEKVTGPLAFGYGAHFSLGLFLPIMDSPGQFHQ
jgi:CRISPR-associated protein Csb2